MAHRHRVQKAHGGRLPHVGRTGAKGSFYQGAGSNTAKEVHKTHGFAEGGAVETGLATGGRAKRKHGGRTGFARGGSPLSSAHSGIGGHGGHAAGAKRAAGGRAPRRHGGACEHDDDDDEDDEGRARGGRMHFVGGKSKAAGMHRKHHAKGGHTDVYITKGGEHYWEDAGRDTSGGKS